ncbi:MAG: enoyl-CoA hydratase/isomerase family protein [Reyranellaceae bacterium]
MPDAPDYQTLVIRRENGVDWVTFNRPERLNALNPRMVDELLDYFQNLYMDHSVRVVALRGAGRAFCAGIDIKETAGANNLRNPADGLRAQRRISEIVMRMRRAPQPIVSLINGPAAGGGFAFALASDIRLAAPAARMNAAFIRLGLSACDIGVSYFLPRLIGAAAASEYMLTGRFIDAEKALKLGLVSQIVPEEKLEEAARGLVDDMLQASPLGLRLTKECLNMSIDAPSLEAAIAMEDRNQILCTASDDFAEGMRAFIEKRPPRYAGS